MALTSVSVDALNLLDNLSSVVVEDFQLLRRFPGQYTGGRAVPYIRCKIAIYLGLIFPDVYSTNTTRVMNSPVSAQDQKASLSGGMKAMYGSCQRLLRSSEISGPMMLVESPI